MSAQPVERPEPSGAPLTVVFDPRSTFAAPPNLLGQHPGQSQMKTWLTHRLAPLAISKQLRAGWHVHLEPYFVGRPWKGALRDRNNKDLITFEIKPGHHL